jgi:hypothetical protein
MFLDTKYPIKQQLVSHIQESVSLVPHIWRKPRVFRHWLLNAHKAQIAVVVLLLLIPFVITPLIDLVLTKIFSPVTKEAYFGLVKTQQMNPHLDGAQTFAHLVVWMCLLLLGMYLYLRHIPVTLEYARNLVKDKISQADRLVDVEPSKSILLYNAAREWNIDTESESDLIAKLESIDSAMHQTNRKSVVMPDGTVVLPISREEPNNTVIADRYQIRRQLGSGAMGTVYLAEDTRLQRDVALKQLAPHFSADEHLRARFRQEALALARLSHPNIVQVYDFIEWDGFFWIAMELIEGVELEEKLKTSGQFETDEALRLVQQMAKALGYAHGRGVIHRDFKPANVLISTNGDAKITDFGIAKLAQSSLHTQINTIMGSPAYMSPEQASGDNTDQRTDIYALGIVLYRMICGELPFKGDAKSVIAQHLTKTPPSLAEKHKGVPEILNDIVQKMLAKDPEERYQSMGEIVEQVVLCL